VTVKIVSEVVDNRGEWRKSSFSNSAGGSCVEAIVGQARTYLRDSKNLSTESPVMAVPSTAWQSFIGGLVRPAER
jgi:hypothetical protein